MHRPYAIAALCVAACAVQGNSALALDARCASLDEVAVSHLQRALGRTDARSTLTANAAMSNLSWARLDCREGRVARGLEAYQQIIAVLAASEAPSGRARGETGPVR